jgi:hypothetical protein
MWIKNDKEIRSGFPTVEDCREYATGNVLTFLSVLLFFAVVVVAAIFCNL